MQLILNLLNKDFNFTDNQLHDALRRSSRSLFNSQHGLGKIVQRFANAEFQKDVLIGNAFIVTKTTLKINELTHLYNLAQAFKNGDKARKIKQNAEKYAICLALICHQQAKQDPKAFDFKYMEELQACYANDNKMATAIKNRKIELMNASSTRKLSVQPLGSLAQSSKGEEKQHSPSNAPAAAQQLTPKQKQPQVEKTAQQASNVVPAPTTPVSLNQASLKEGSQKKVALTIEIPKSAALGGVIPIGAIKPPVSLGEATTPVLSSIHIDTPIPSEKKDSPDLRSPRSQEAPHTPPSSPVLPPRLSISVPGTPSKSSHRSPVVSPRVLENKEGQQGANQPPVTGTVPAVSSIQESLEKARWWKTALAITVAILTLPTLIIPALCYFVWKRAKENEAVQKIERKDSEFTTVQLYRQGLNSPKLANEKTVTPEQLVAAADANEKAAQYLLKGQAKQFRFYEDRMKQGQTAVLNEKERQMLLNNKEEDVILAQTLRI